MSFIIAFLVVVFMPEVLPYFLVELIFVLLLVFLLHKHTSKRRIFFVSNKKLRFSHMAPSPEAFSVAGANALKSWRSNKDYLCSQGVISTASVVKVNTRMTAVHCKSRSNLK